MNSIDNSPFFIIGSPRSGTTLLERLLNRHSRLFIPPETVFFNKLNRFERSCNYQSEKEALIKFVDFYLQQRAVKLLDLPEEKIREILLFESDSFVDVLYNLMAYLLKLADKPRWGEKTPHHLTMLMKIASTIPEAKFIILLRDGRAVVKSRMKQPNWKDNFLSASRIWRADMDRIVYAKTTLDSDRLCQVRYEDLITEPETTLKTVLNFLGETYSDDLFNEPKNQVSLFDKYYSQPWMSKSTTSIDTSRANNWEKEYSPTELVLVQKLIGSKLKLMDYPLKDVKSNFWLFLFVLHFLKDIGYQTRRVKKKFSRERFS